MEDRVSSSICVEEFMLKSADAVCHYYFLLRRPTCAFLVLFLLYACVHKLVFG